MEQGPRQPVVDDVPRGTVISGDMNKVEASELCGLCPGESLATGRHWATLLSRFAESVFRWSGRISLVSAGDRHSLVNKHILPAVALRPLILSVPHGSVWDVGSGAGFPGVPLAVTMPDTKFLLIESRRRRASFLREAVRELPLPNAVVVHAFLDGGLSLARSHAPADVIVSRAAMSVVQLLACVRGGTAAKAVSVTTLSPGETLPSDCLDSHGWCIDGHQGSAVLRRVCVEQ